MNSWIKDAIFYEVYPTSFMDKNGDGIGDIGGIESKLNYIESLGCNAIWLNACFSSPFKDGGYDVTDYYTIDKRVGKNGDMDSLISAAHAKGIKIVLDLVVGHTSDRHPWFIKSQQAEKNEYSDYYHWTNSCFVGSPKMNMMLGITERDGGYGVNFFASQPALNYGFNFPTESWQMHYKDDRLKPLREEVLKIMRFWLNKGVDGFRVDLANSLVKNDTDGEGIIWLWSQLITPIKKDFPECVFIAEWCRPKLSVGKCGFDIDFLLHDNEEFNELCRNEKGTNILPSYEKGNNYFSKNGLGTVENMLNLCADMEEVTVGKGYFSIPTGNHDLIRLAHKKDSDELKTIFAFLYTFKHIPFIYYGDEVGQEYYNVPTKDGGYIRTGARLPMKWNEEKNSGFSTNEQTYLPIIDDKINVDAQLKDGNSLLNLVKKLGRLRRNNSCFNADGIFELLECTKGGYPLIFRRKDKTCSFLVIISPSEKNVIVNQKYSDVLLSHNCTDINGALSIKIGFAIIKEKV